jgi:predicted aspartyl protease
VLSSRRRSAINVHVNIEYKRKMYRASLDTGCDLSALGSKIRPELSYQACTTNLYAANSTTVPILGSAVVAFRIAGMMTEYEFLVSDAVEEIILGADWLIHNKCFWDFEASTLEVSGISGCCNVSLKTATHQGCVRRLCVRDTVDIPPYSQLSVPVRSVWTLLPSASVDWLVEPKIIRQGVMVARTLLSSSGDEAYVRMPNCNPSVTTLLVW